MRFRLQSLLTGIAYFAIGCTALANPNDNWASVIVTLTVVTIIASGVAAIFGRGENRAFLGGLAISSIAYLVAVFAPGSMDNIAPYLATTKALSWASQTFPGYDSNIQTVAFSPDGTRLATSYRDNSVRIWNVGTGKLVAGGTTGADPVLFFRIGHCLSALIVGCLGGILARSSTSASIFVV